MVKNMVNMVIWLPAKKMKDLAANMVD